MAPPGSGFWEANCGVLRRVYPGLLEELLRLDTGAAFGIETAASGDPTLVVNGAYVHSPRNPAREGEKLARALLAEAEDDDRPVLALGFGLGYAAEAAARLAPQRPLVVVEKDPGLLCAAFRLRDLTALLSRPAVAFVPGGEGEAAIAVLSFFEKNPRPESSGEKPTDKKRAPVVLRNRALADADARWYSAVENRVRAWATQGDVNRATLGKFGGRWTRNLARNMPALRDAPGVSRLEGLAGGGRPLPVFLAAAGPSLDRVGPLLSEIKKRCIVVAVDTSVRCFLANGAEPDFVVAVDPQFWNGRHLDRCGGWGSARLVAEPAVYPSVLRLPFAGVFLCGSLFPLGAFVERRVDPKGLLGAGGSVATSAWDFCRLLGAGQIWVAGLDLAFPGNRTHYRGALFAEIALGGSLRLRPAETFLYAAMRSGAPFAVPSADGGRVLTDRRLSLYASWFENSLRAGGARTCGARNFRLLHGDGENGAAISGFEPARTEDILALPDLRKETDARLAAAFSRIEAEFNGEAEAAQRKARYEAALAGLSSGLESIKAACAEGEKLAAGALRNAGTPALREKTLAKLEETDRAMRENGAWDAAVFLLPEESARETPRPAEGCEAAFRRHMEARAGRYAAIARAASLAWGGGG